jgi:hypothetical protein
MPGKRAALSLVPDEPDQLPRLEQFRAEQGWARRVFTPWRRLGPGHPARTLSLAATSQPGAWCGQHTARDVAEWQNGVPGENCQRKTIVCGLVKSVPERPDKSHAAGREPSQEWRQTTKTLERLRWPLGRPLSYPRLILTPMHRRLRSNALPRAPQPVLGLSLSGLARTKRRWICIHRSAGRGYGAQRELWSYAVRNWARHDK